MYNDLFTLGGLTVHGYGLMIGLGFLLAIWLGIRRGAPRGLDTNAVLSLGLLSIFTGFAGAKLLYILVNLRAFFRSPLSVLGSEGFVVYGGILLALAAAWLWCRRKGLDFFFCLDTLAPSVALAQGFGRIGCFLAGCCYGRETTGPLGVVFPQGSAAPAGVPLLPTQLFSAAGDLLLMGLLLVIDRRKRRTGDTGAWYLLLYAAGRFAVECFRADARGSVGPLSTSQFVSLLLIPAAGLLFYRNRRRKERSEP